MLTHAKLLVAIAFLLGILGGHFVWTNPPSLVTFPEVSASPSATQVFNPTEDEIKMIKYNIFEGINNFRTENKLQPIKYDPRLQAYADLRAKEDLVNKEVQHEGAQAHIQDGTAPRCTYSNTFPGEFGENAWTTPTWHVTGTDLVQDWINSPVHRSGLLRPDFHYYAIGVYLNSVLLEFCP